MLDWPTISVTTVGLISSIDDRIVCVPWNRVIKWVKVVCVLRTVVDIVDDGLMDNDGRLVGDLTNITPLLSSCPIVGITEVLSE